MMEKKYDLLVSHNQIRFRSKPYSDSDHQWGPGNIEQGFIVGNGVVVADPLAEGAFGANVIVRLADAFQMDANTQRAVSINFNILDADDVTVSSATEQFKVDLPFQTGDCTLFYEVCLEDEVYYIFTVVTSISDKSFSLLKDDWGLEKGQEFVAGKF